MNKRLGEICGLAPARGRGGPVGWRRALAAGGPREFRAHPIRGPEGTANYRFKRLSAP